jgi:hypothetical protein
VSVLSFFALLVLILIQDDSGRNVLPALRTYFDGNEGEIINGRYEYKPSPIVFAAVPASLLFPHLPSILDVAMPRSQETVERLEKMEEEERKRVMERIMFQMDNGCCCLPLPLISSKHNHTHVCGCLDMHLPIGLP